VLLGTAANNATLKSVSRAGGYGIRQLHHLNTKQHLMSEIITRSKPGGRKIHNTKVDLTPMVDLGFLLITFFVFTTTMSTNVGMKLILPKDDHVGMPVAESGAVTIIPDENKIWYYEGNIPTNKDQMIAIDYSDINNLRSRLIGLKNRLIAANGDVKKLMVMIKPTAMASFSNMVDMLDEMKICGLTRYALLDVDRSEQKMIAEK
jgi:biopolymer transport protein ExbD